MKKLIIVCEEKLRHYGDFLAQLMSSSDDAEGQIVGLKDGAAAAQVWTEKEYASNAAQISSEQYLLFIGDSKLMKEKRMHMQKKYSEYGMNYGWLGKQGVLFVDRVISYAEYEEFYKLLRNKSAEGSQPEATRLIEVKAENSKRPVSIIEAETEDTTVEDAPEILEKEQPTEKGNMLRKFIAPIGKNAKSVVKRAVDFGTQQVNKVSDNFAVAKNSRSIEDQEYTCLVLMFYLKALSTFLGLSEV